MHRESDQQNYTFPIANNTQHLFRSHLRHFSVVISVPCIVFGKDTVFRCHFYLFYWEQKHKSCDRVGSHIFCPHGTDVHMYGKGELK